MIKYTESTVLEAINRIAATEDGKIFFSALKDQCKWDMTLTSSEEPHVTQFYAAIRGVYGGIRKKIDPEHLKDIEFNYQLKEEKNDGRKPRKHGHARSKSTK